MSVVSQARLVNIELELLRTIGLHLLPRSAEWPEGNLVEDEFRIASIDRKAADRTAESNAAVNAAHLDNAAVRQVMLEPYGIDAHVCQVSSPITNSCHCPDVTSGPDMALTCGRCGRKNRLLSYDSSQRETPHLPYDKNRKEESVSLCAGKQALSCRACLAQSLGAPSSAGTHLYLWYPRIFPPKNVVNFVAVPQRNPLRTVYKLTAWLIEPREVAVEVNSACSIVVLKCHSLCN